MSTLNLQDEIDQLKKRLGNMNNKPLVLENPISSDDDEETISNTEPEQKVEETKVEETKVEEPLKIRRDSEKTQQPISSPSGEYKQYSPKNKVSFEQDSEDDKDEKEDTNKIIKNTFQKIKENLKVFEELTMRTIRENKDLDLLPDEIEFLEDQYEHELELFENTMKILRNKLPDGLDFTEQQYSQLERRINLVEKRFDKFISKL